MYQFIKSFRSDEDGAVTVDWVVLTAAVAGLCIALVAELNNETSGLSQLTGDFLSEGNPGDYRYESEGAE